MVSLVTRQGKALIMGVRPETLRQVKDLDDADILKEHDICIQSTY